MVLVWDVHIEYEVFSEIPAACVGTAQRAPAVEGFQGRLGCLLRWHCVGSKYSNGR